MAITFPATPVVGSSIYYSGRQWTWDGTSWNLSIGGTGQVRWSYQASGGETVISGIANVGTNIGNTLGYTVGNEQVYFNGVLLVRGSDYTAYDGASITLTSALLYGDVVDIIVYQSLTVSTGGGGSSALVKAKGDLSVGQLPSLAATLSVGADGTILAADSSQTLGMGWQDYTVTPLDDIRYKFDGIESRYYPMYQGSVVTITNPYRLILSINGIIQTVSLPEYVWQSPLTWDGFMIDSEGYLSFSEVPPAGSTFWGVVNAGSNITPSYTYPFKAVDLLLGAY
jgi:hypothetical protein